MRFFLFLFILFLAPNVYSATNYEYTYNKSGNGTWTATPIDSPPPTTYYDPSQFSNPMVDSPGNIIGTLPVDNLPVPSDPSGIPGISEKSLIKVGDLAATVAPYLAQLVALSPQARVAIGGASTLFQLWSAYYTASVTHPLASSSLSLKCSNGTSLTASQVCGVGLVIMPDRGGPNPCGAPSGFCCAAQISYYPDGLAPVRNIPRSVCGNGTASLPSASSTTTVPAPTTAQLIAQMKQSPADALQYLQNLPANVAQKIPVTDTTTGPSSFVEPSTVTTVTNPDGSTVTTTKTVTDHLTYNGPNVYDSQTTLTVTKTCTPAGSCSSTVTQSQPDRVSPFIAPTVNFGPSGLTAAVQGMQNTMPFSSIGFGSSWLPQSCMPEPTWHVDLPFGGFSHTFALPTDDLCTLASDMRPFVLAGGGILALMILAW
jgi:hypothetical protein